MQLRHYVEFQKELAINYCKLAVVSVDPAEVNDAFRTGLGASFPFLSDHERKVVRMLDMTETSKSRGVTAAASIEYQDRHPNSSGASRVRSARPEIVPGR